MRSVLCRVMLVLSLVMMSIPFASVGVLADDEEITSIEVPLKVGSSFLLSCYNDEIQYNRMTYSPTWDAIHDAERANVRVHPLDEYGTNVSSSRVAGTSGIASYFQINRSCFAFDLTFMPDDVVLESVRLNYTLQSGNEYISSCDGFAPIIYFSIWGRATTGIGYEYGVSQFSDDDTSGFSLGSDMAEAGDVSQNFAYIQYLKPGEMNWIGVREGHDRSDNGQSYDFGDSNYVVFDDYSSIHLWVRYSGGSWNYVADEFPWIMGFIYICMVFVPALILNLIIPRWGFIGGFAVMSIVLAVEQPSAIWFTVIALMSCGVMALGIRGDG